jgi:hypothetical protein
MMVSKIEASLDGFEIGLSGAVPDRAEWDEPAQDRAILEFVALLSGLIFKYGGRVVHGSHPTFTPVIMRQAQLHAGERAGRPPLTLLMSELWAKDLDDVERREFGHQAEFIIVPQVGEGGSENGEVRNRSLTLMRHHLVQSMNVLVAVGGKKHTADGLTPGLAEELALAQKRGMACFLVGGLGGMAAAIARHSTADYGVPLKNELSPHTNETLLTTRDVGSCVSIIFDHMIRAPWLTKRALSDLETAPESTDSESNPGFAGA